MSLANLKALDLNNLDFKNPGTWPFPVMVLACILLLIVIPIAGYHFKLSDQYSELERITNQENQLRSDFEVKAKEAASLTAYKKQMEEIQDIFDVLLKQLPKDTEVPELLEDVTKAGLTSGLEFSEIKLLREVSRPYYSELPVQIVVTGNYHAFASFATKVAALPRIVTIDDFTMKPVKEGDSSVINITVLAKTYRYKDNVK